MASDPSAILALDAVEMRDRLASGALTAAALVEACIARLEEREPEIQAWAWFDADHARAQAASCDRLRATGRPIGPLHGLPVGLKDIIDTRRMPTEYGTAQEAGRVPLFDAAIVERLRAAGAILMGKTRTTELAFLDPGPTRNPHNRSHTPGGSSSGSAAAVAAQMVPLAVGTQTGGSVIRPASYCGVTGFKPTFGTVPRKGILPQSPSLDTVGVFAASPSGAALLAEVLAGAPPDDPAAPVPPPARLLATTRADPPLPPVFAIVQPPGWEDAHEDLKAAFDELADALGDRAFEVQLPEAFGAAARQREIVNLAEMARCYHSYGRGERRDLLGAELRRALEAGEAIFARDYLAALDWPTVLNAALDEVFERCDAIICPAATGPAPEGLDSTGSAIFNGLWTFCGTPSVSVPALTATTGLPMGVQLVAARGEDARLLRTARWLDDWIGG